MKAAAHHHKCMFTVPGDARAGICPPLHAPRRRSSFACRLRESLAESIGLGQQLGKRIRSVELMSLDAIAGADPHSETGSAIKRVLLIDADAGSAAVFATLLAPEALVVHVATLADARARLRNEIFSVVVIDPSLPDGDAAELLPALFATPLLVYSACQPKWQGVQASYLPKPWTSPRQLWLTISGMLGIAGGIAAGD